ncbi:phage tail protein [Streptococcus dysgalactiae subsp. equisimilis]|nr:hypothetical protein [Streptococcus dysgalactiae]VTT18319.1 phage tail protein [Streptococcus dysgalactiae subsp. equisimilis]
MTTMTFNDVDLSSLITIMSVNRDHRNERQVELTTLHLLVCM